jgi:hypothetical protein
VLKLLRIIACLHAFLPVGSLAVVNATIMMTKRRVQSFRSHIFPGPLLENLNGQLEAAHKRLIADLQVVVAQLSWSCLFCHKQYSTPAGTGSSYKLRLIRLYSEFS